MPCLFYSQENPCTHCKGGWVGPRSILDFCKTEKLVVSAGIQTPDFPAHNLAIILISSSCSPECYREDKNFSLLQRLEKRFLFSHPVSLSQYQLRYLVSTAVKEKFKSCKTIIHN